MPTDLAGLVDLVSRGGLVTLLVLGLWGFYNEKWVSGTTYQRVLKERDAYRDELLTTLRVADRATRITERTVDIANERLHAERRIRTREPSDEV